MRKCNWMYSFQPTISLLNIKVSTIITRCFSTVLFGDMLREMRKKDSPVWITLIEIPYWWNGKKESLMATIHEYHPEFITTAFGTPIPKKIPTKWLIKGSEIMTSNLLLNLLNRINYRLVWPLIFVQIWKWYSKTKTKKRNALLKKLIIKYVLSEKVQVSPVAVYILSKFVFLCEIWTLFLTIVN